jgi:hypothetical protein
MSAPTLKGSDLIERLEDLLVRMVHMERLNASINGKHSPVLLSDIDAVKLAIATMREGAA